MRFTNRQRKAIRDGYKSLFYVQDRLGPMMDDPMTAAMGAPVGDFVEKWEREARGRQGRALTQLRSLGIGDQLQEMLVEELTAHV